MREPTPIDWAPFRAALPTLFHRCWPFLEAGSGWYRLLWGLCDELDVLAVRQVVAGGLPVRLMQVKEKMGELRVHLVGSSVEAYELCEEARKASQTVCEFYGGEGELVYSFPRNWNKTVCLACRDLWCSPWETECDDRELPSPRRIQ